MDHGIFHNFDPPVSLTNIPVTLNLFSFWWIYTSILVTSDILFLLPIKFPSFSLCGKLSFILTHFFCEINSNSKITPPSSGLPIGFCDSSFIALTMLYCDQLFPSMSHWQHLARGHCMIPQLMTPIFSRLQNLDFKPIVQDLLTMNFIISVGKYEQCSQEQNFKLPLRTQSYHWSVLSFNKCFSSNYCISGIVWARRDKTVSKSVKFLTLIELILQWGR